MSADQPAQRGHFERSVTNLLRRQVSAVDAHLAVLLRARGVDPDDRTEGWEDRARAVLGDLEIVDGPVEWLDDYRVRMTTTIRKRQP